VLLSAYLWFQLDQLGGFVQQGISKLTSDLSQTIEEVGDKATQDAVKALDERSREAIERLTTDTAREVASFLYDRDQDILKARHLPLEKEAFRNFLRERNRPLTRHGQWVLNSAKDGWVAGNFKDQNKDIQQVEASLKDNSKQFNYRPGIARSTFENRPLYREITLVDLNGQEQIKISTLSATKNALLDISNGRNTYIGSERYFEKLKQLKPGEIYVSDVIGAYLPSPVIGKYTPAAAAKKGIAFEPEKAGYAGKENPVGKRFEAIVRWATPVVKDTQIVGYVTLALDHSHLMEFTDHIVPTAERYSDISDASTGNYAFMWDYEGRNISHPRDYFIVGYDPKTGQQAVPFLEDRLYEEWQQSELAIGDFLKQAPTFREQGLDKKPAKQLVKQGMLGLDCRFLNFAPQCQGWMNLTQHGGSGSFVIFWSGLWKLTTAASIPYFTGQYADSPRGFGFITIGANVHEFHAPALESEKRLENIIGAQREDAANSEAELQNAIGSSLTTALLEISTSTLLLTVLVIGIAVWMASYLSKRITHLIEGIGNFKQGNLSFRLQVKSQDEMGELTRSINDMAENLEMAFNELQISEQNLQNKNELNQKLMTDMRQEIEERKRAQQSLNQLAYFDELTELPNRFHLMEYLEQILQNQQEKIAVFFLDLDGFKYINDTLGHHLGDKLLLSVANRLNNHSRKDDFIARLGGDEFTILVRFAPDDIALGRMAENLINVLSEKFNVMDNEVYITASIGIATFPEQGSNINDLLKNADTAMYFAKDQGKGCYRFWNEDLKSQSETRLKMASNLRSAIGNDEFMLYYQPKIDTETLALVGFEALLRWNSRMDGFIPPDQFIPVAEETGVILEIGEWVFYQVAEQIKNWRQQGFKVVPVSVNVSAKQFNHPDSDLTALILKVSEEFDIDPSFFDVELTETQVMQSPEKTIQILEQLKSINVSVSIDDFGTGYSSLSYLRRFKVSTIKIDKSFVRDMEVDQSDVDLASSIIEMGHSVGLKVVAEGVETLGQQNLLRNMNCDYLQGYLFSKPLPATEVEVWLKTDASADN